MFSLQMKKINPDKIQKPRSNQICLISIKNFYRYYQQKLDVLRAGFKFISPEKNKNKKI